MMDYSFIKKRLDNGSRLHFIGCGGVGTAPLMKIFYEKGFAVSGSDLEQNALTRDLSSRGIPVFIGHSRNNLPPEGGEQLIIVYSSAVSDDNPELVEGRRRGAVCLRRGEILGLLSHIFRRVISVSGSHGKTSISAMISFCLYECGYDPGFLIGGEVCSWPHNGECGSGDLFVAEVDESDGTHTCIDSWLGVVPNVEDDHVWSVGGIDCLYKNFQTYQTRAENLLFVGDKIPDQLFGKHPNAKRLDSSALETSFDTDFQGRLSRVWGGYQKRNQETALAVLELIGVPGDLAIRTLAKFPGVERRLTKRFDNGMIQIIEDYAHHPTELQACLNSVKAMHYNRRILAVFQPHRYARLDRYFNQFAEILKTADLVYLPPVFAAWNQSGKYNSEMLAARIGSKARMLLPVLSWAERAQCVVNDVKAGDVICVIGAGDVKDMIPCLVSLIKSKIF